MPHFYLSSSLRIYVILTIHWLFKENTHRSTENICLYFVLSEPSGFELPSREAIFPLPPLSSFLSLLRIVWSLAAVDRGEGGAGA